MAPETIGMIIAVGSLALTIGGALIVFGRFQGRVGEKTNRHDKDIGELWMHQRGQDTLCASERTGTARALSGLDATMKSVVKNSEETRADVKEIRKIVLENRQ